MNKTILSVPKYETEVLIEFNDDLTQIKVDYIPNKCYTEKELKKEVEIIINEVLKSIVEEVK